MACSLTGLAQTKDIVINEKTYKKLTNPGVNHVRMAKKADKRNGIVRVKDAPHERLMFEKLISQDPTTGELPNNFRERELKFLLENKNQLRSRTKSTSNVWESKGPYNVGGRTRALAIDIDNDNIILAGGVSGGMWRSENQGQSWEKMVSANDNQSVTAVAQDTREGYRHIWYYCTGEVLGNSAGAKGASYNGSGVYKSIDGGKNWFQVESTNQYDIPLFSETLDLCWNITVDKKNGDVYVATLGKIWRLKNIDENSENSDMTLETVLHSYPGRNDDWSYYTDVISTPNGVKYATLSSAGGVRGIFRSTTGDNGSWNDITPSNFPSLYKRTVLAYAPSNENILYFLAQTPEEGFEGHSIWKLTIDGDTYTWEDRSQNLPAKDTDGVAGYKSQGSYNMIIKVAPDDENMVFIGGTNLHRSDDGFATNANPVSIGNPEKDKSKTYWIGGYSTENDISQYDNQHPDQHALVFLKDGHTLISGHDGGLSITTNYKQTEDSGIESDRQNTSFKPVDWTTLNNGYLTTQAYAIALDKNDLNSLEIMSGFQDNSSWLYTTDNTGAYSRDWLEVGTGDGGYCSLHGKKGAFIFTAQRGVTYLYVNNIGYNRIDPKDVDSDELLFINPYEVEANNEEIIYFSGGTSLWRHNNMFDIPKYSEQTAESGWLKLVNTEQEDNGIISAIESSVKPANRIYFGTSTGKVFKMINAHQGQPTAIDITSPKMPEGAYIKSIVTNPANADYVMVAFSNYEIPSIFYTEDGGESWTDVSGKLEYNGTNNKGEETNIGPSVRSVSIVNAKEGTVFYAATSIGLFKANELSQETNWTQVDPQGIGNSVVAMIESRTDGYVAIGTHGNGIYSTKLEPGEPQVDPADPTDQIAVGIEDPVEAKTRLSIYPNPMVNGSRVEFPNENNESYRLIVIDASGRVVRIIENITNNNVLINREQLKPGIHIINLEGEKIYKGKFLVK